MTLTHDRQITLSVGNSRRDTAWVQTTMTVSALYDRLGVSVRGAETLDAYRKLPKAKQDDLKDVGGFVGGSLRGLRRKAENVVGRDLITLDFDNVPGWQTELVVSKTEELLCSYCIYSTRKHSPDAPRLRVILPLDRTVTPDEYEPCARRVAAFIGIGMADPTTFQSHRLMFWPSCCADSEAVYRYKDAPFLSADFLLETYADWHDFLSWPQVPNAVSYKKLAMKQGDPTEKNGTVGAFCRTYDVYAAMEKYLPRIYDPVAGDPERFTYLGGSTTGGAIVYDGGKFLYSHHATDPCSGRLVNAFDLVRLHKFGDLDDNATPDVPVGKLPSYAAMCTLALGDRAVCATINREQLAAVENDFAGIAGGGKTAGEDGGECVADQGMHTSASGAASADNWMDELERTQSGAIKSTINNNLLILNGDPRLKGRFALNQFAGRGEVLDALPWSTDTKRRLWSDTDSNGLYWYMERAWGITGRGNIDSALDIHAALHAFNDVQDYLRGLDWDGVERLDTLFIDYLGAEDNAYNRAVTRKSFTAAVARAMTPGVKFDNMLILCGRQGVGKSTILDKMSRGWYNDSISTFEGKEASELLQGVWLVEIAELDAFRKSDISRIKQFLSLRADRYRAAYGRHVRELPRSCVFFGTCNNFAFLQDSTGNRRFWPVDIGIREPTKDVFRMADADVDQIWAEAKTRWQLGEELFLTGEAAEMALCKQEEHREVSGREGLVQEFVGRPVPSDWARWSIDRRRDFWAGTVHAPTDSSMVLLPRDRVCVMEIWCELFGGNMRDIKTADTREISAILAGLPGWERAEKSMRFGPYSTQRGFVFRGSNA